MSTLVKTEKPRRDFRKLYESIAKSKWFIKAYHGKSMGETIKIEQ